MTSLLRRFLDQSGFAESRITLLMMGVGGACAAAFMPWTRIGGQIVDPTLFDSGPGQPDLSVMRLSAVVAFAACALCGGRALRQPLDRRARRVGVVFGCVAGLAAVVHLLDLRGTFLAADSLGGLLHDWVGAANLRPAVGMWMTLAAGALIAVKSLFAAVVEPEDEA